jgi:hypothetical protein
MQVAFFIGRILSTACRFWGKLFPSTNSVIGWAKRVRKF